MIEVQGPEGPKGTPGPPGFSERQIKDLFMMQSANWPGRTLCLKRYLPEHQMEFADLMRRGEGRWIFIPLDYGQPETGDHSMLQKLVSEGWLVD